MTTTLVISTFGRSLWILDDITPLREINPQITAADAHLFIPAPAMRVRWENYQDTPYPIETPAGQNPPDGAILDYYLKTPPAGDMTLTIYDGKGGEVAQFSSEAKPAAYLPANAPRLLVCSRGHFVQDGGRQSLCVESAVSAPACASVRVLRQTAGVHRIHTIRSRRTPPHAPPTTSRTAGATRQVHHRTTGWAVRACDRRSRWNVIHEFMPRPPTCLTNLIWRSESAGA